MPGNLTLEALKEKVANRQIDTVITAIPDMQGRLMGKRFQRPTSKCIPSMVTLRPVGQQAMAITS
jgi:hypothetical protein